MDRRALWLLVIATISPAAAVASVAIDTIRSHLTSIVDEAKQEVPGFDERSPFLQHDSNGDFVLSRDELLEGFAFLQIPAGEGSVDEIIARYGNDGTPPGITFDGFQRLIAPVDGDDASCTDDGVSDRSDRARWKKTREDFRRWVDRLIDQNQLIDRSTHTIRIA